MLISVITPVYNAAEFLPACIDSVLSQQMSDFEVLLIDDGSADNSGNICDQYAACDARIRVFHTPNQGASSARNLGLDHAQGTFVVFIDADDFVTADHLQQFIDSGIGEDGIAFTTMVEERPRHRHYYTIPETPLTRGHDACMLLLVELIRGRCFGWTCNKMFSRATIERHKLRFDKNIHLIEDEIFTAQYCAHITHISGNSHPTYHYRFVPTSMGRRRLDPLMVVRTRWHLLNTFIGLKYSDEVIYIAARTQFSRTRRLIRHGKWCSETTGQLLDSLFENWKIIRQYGHPKFRKSFYDTKTFCFGCISCGLGCRGWAKLTIKAFHL